MLLTSEELIECRDTGTPVRVRNPHTEAVVLQPDPSKDVVLRWDGKTRDGQVDSVLVPAELLSHQQLVKAFAIQLLEPVHEEDPMLALAEGRLKPYVSSTARGAEMASQVKRSSNNVKAAMRTCVMPESGGVCGAPAPLTAGQTIDDVPPLCSGHQPFADRFLSRPTGRLLATGAQEIGWYHK